MSKPPFPYFGGKQRIAGKLIDLFPEHNGYIEPYAGGLSVLFAKPPKPLEVINDLNSYLVTFWRVLRERPEELERVCSLTPHAREEFEMSSTRDGITDLETARRVWVLLTQGRSAIWKNAGWRHFKNMPKATGFAIYMDAYRERLSPAAERLRNVQIECRPALDIIRTYGAFEGNLLYVDPPYMGDTRRNISRYEIEMKGAVEHQEMLAELKKCKASVVLSGYANPLYADALPDWACFEIGSRTQVSERTETVWMNFKPPALLDIGYE